MKIITAILMLYCLTFTEFAISSGGGGGGGGGGSNYKEITPPIVVNLPDPNQSRLMQVSIAVFSTNAEVLSAIDKNLPLIRNNLIMLFASQNKDVVKTKDGREKLRKEAEDVVNSALKEVNAPPIEALYFTGLVIQ